MKVDDSRRYRLSRHADLKTRSEGDILVLPEQAMRLGGSSGEILRLVIEGGSEASIVATLQDRYPDSPDLALEVRRFLERMLENGGIIRIDANEPPMKRP